MSKVYKLSLNLPGDLNCVGQRILEGHGDVVVTRQGGYVGKLTHEQLKIAEADPYITVGEAGKLFIEDEDTDVPEATKRVASKPEAADSDVSEGGAA